MQFAHPVFLYITLGLVPLVIAAAFWIHWQRRRDLKAFGEPAMVNRLMRHISEGRIQIRGAAFGLGLLLLSLALSGPQYGAKMVEVQRQGVDVMIALDVSRSMLAEDIKPNRLTRAQQELTALVDRLDGDRVGVVAFAGSGHVVCPLTTDYQAAKMFLNYTTPYSVAVQGTRLGQAVRTALAAYPEGGEGHRVLVLLTDGEDHDSEPGAAAREAKAASVKILAIGFGSPQGEPIPRRGEDGSTSGYHTDRQGKTVVSRLDETTLKQMAEATQGAYLPAHSGALEAETVAGLIDQMQKRNLSAGRYGASEDRYQFLLLPALLLLLFSFWLPERRKSWLLLLPLMLLASSASWAGTADDVNRGNAAYHKKKYDKAVQAYRDAQINAPHDPVVAYDLGNGLHQSGQHKEAEQAYQKALTHKHPEVRAKAYYNLGNNYVAQQRYEEAVKSYHQALKLKPRDEDTIYNLSQTLGLMKQPPQPDPKQKPDQKNQKGSKPQPSDQPAQAQAGQEGKDKPDQPKGTGDQGKEDRKGPDDKGERDAEQSAGQDTPEDTTRGRAPKPGEMSQEDAENVLDAVRESEQSALRDRLRQPRQATAENDEDW